MKIKFYNIDDNMTPCFLAYWPVYVRRYFQILPIVCQEVAVLELMKEFNYRPSDAL